MSPSTWGCGLKHIFLGYQNQYKESPSTWGCGLKQLANKPLDDDKCHPLREGVDWNISISAAFICRYVTLYVRVWIETLRSFLKFTRFLSPSTWGCGLKQYNSCFFKQAKYGHPLREGVDWNLVINRLEAEMIKVTLYVRVWIETLRNWYSLALRSVTLYVRVWIET